MGKMKEKVMDEENSTQSESTNVENEENKNDEGLKTEITSIAEEEKRTGEKIDVPSPEELVARASTAIISDRKRFMSVFRGLGKRAKDRVVSAVLDLPTGGLPVKLQSEEEKLAYSYGQRVINHRFTVTFHHINQEIKAAKEAEQNQKGESQEKGENNAIQES